MSLTQSPIIELSDYRTNPKYGCSPNDRSLEQLLKNGIIVIDKPRGPSSHEVVAWLKDILNIQKAGHSGTLDPKVTGLLPIALEDGTKILRNLLDTGKEYVCLMRLHDGVEKDRLLDVISLFVGIIYQRPPVKSAVKRQIRKREVYSIEVLDIMDRFVLMKVDCESGTYIRKLVYDIGMALGCGANMAELRRTRVGSFTEKDLVTLQQLKDAFHYYKEDNDKVSLGSLIFPLESAVRHLPRVWLRDSAIDAICHGANVAVPGISRMDNTINKNDKVAILSLKDELVAIGISLADAKKIKKIKKGFVVNTHRVVMKEGTYPRYWKGSS